jgi:membrane protein implicated in regulation of membrane protease activity
VTLGWKLFLVFLAFLSILTTVIMMAFRERRLAREIRSEDIEAQRSADGRVMTIIFTAIIGGMGLTILTAWLVFF